MAWNRRQVLQLSVGTAAVAAGAPFEVTESAVAAESGGASETYRAVNPVLDSFIQRYLRDRKAPGMTLVLADRAGVQRVVTFGFGDVERARSVGADELFEIGSISKSFVALCLLQLRDEGKLDLNKPVTDYLPWFRIDSRFPPITTHHLLTHGSGLPGNGEVFFADPAQRHRAAHAPGEHFHYNNMAFALLGHLAWTLDGRELPVVIRKRILEPLGMTQTEPVITLDIRDRLVKSYSAFQNDRPDSSSMRLAEAPALIETKGDGCVASTARDMGAYVRMIANGGTGPHGRLVSQDSFALFCKPHIVADEFGPTAHYGYGIAVDRLDGNRVVRHTGGMVSFMSAILVDIDEGVGAFASINAMQDYRPTPVVQYAAQLMRGARARKDLSSVPVPKTLPQIADDAGYVGTYRDPAGRELVVGGGSGALWLLRGQERIVLEPSSEADRFIVRDHALAHFAFMFTRKDAKDPKSAITEVAWGSDWYASTAYAGPKQFNAPKEWLSYAGHYRNESPWIGSLRIVIRKGQLWIDGVIPLVAEGDRFFLRDEDHSPEWIAFGQVVNGRCMRLSFSGVEMLRQAAD